MLSALWGQSTTSGPKRLKLAVISSARNKDKHRLSVRCKGPVKHKENVMSDLAVGLEAMCLVISCVLLRLPRLKRRLQRRRAMLNSIPKTLELPLGCATIAIY